MRKKNNSGSCRTRVLGSSVPSVVDAILSKNVFAMVKVVPQVTVYKCEHVAYISCSAHVIQTLLACLTSDNVTVQQGQSLSRYVYTDHQNLFYLTKRT